MNGCGGIDPRESGYSNREKIFLKFLIIVVTLLLLVLIAVSIYGNLLFAPGLDHFFTKVSNESQSENDIITSILPRLNDVNANQTYYKGYVSALDRDGNDTLNKGSNGENFIVKNDSARVSLLGISLGIVGIAIVLALAAIMCNLSLVSMIMAYVGFFAMFMLWVNIAVHFPVIVAISDLCYDSINYTIPNRLDDRNNSYGLDYGTIGDIMACANWNNTNRTYGFAISLKQDAISQQEFILNQTTLTANDTATYEELQANIEILEAVEADCLYLRNCLWILRVLDKPTTNEICGQRLNGIVIIWASSFVLSLLLIPYTIFGIMGYKRFGKPKDEGFF